MKKAIVTFVLMILAMGIWIAIVILIQPIIFPEKKVWGNGELPANWQGYFGNDNKARLDYVQTNTINNQGQRIAELALRISKLEDPNAVTKRKTPDKP